MDGRGQIGLVGSIIRRDPFTGRAGTAHHQIMVGMVAVLLLLRGVCR